MKGPFFITSQHLTGILGAPQDPKQTLQQHMGQEQNYPQGQDIKILGWGREPGGYSYEDLPFRYPRTGNWIFGPEEGYPQGRERPRTRMQRGYPGEDGEIFSPEEGYSQGKILRGFPQGKSIQYRPE